MLEEMGNKHASGIGEKEEEVDSADDSKQETQTGNETKFAEICDSCGSQADESSPVDDLPNHALSKEEQELGESDLTENMFDEEHEHVSLFEGETARNGLDLDSTSEQNVTELNNVAHEHDVCDDFGVDERVLVEKKDGSVMEEAVLSQGESHSRSSKCADSAVIPHQNPQELTTSSHFEAKSDLELSEIKSSDTSNPKETCNNMEVDTEIIKKCDQTGSDNCSNEDRDSSIDAKTDLGKISSQDSVPEVAVEPKAVCSITEDNLDQSHDQDDTDESDQKFLREEAEPCKVATEIKKSGDEANGGESRARLSIESNHIPDYAMTEAELRKSPSFDINLAVDQDSDQTPLLHQERSSSARMHDEEVEAEEKTIRMERSTCDVLISSLKQEKVESFTCQENGLNGPSSPEDRTVTSSKGNGKRRPRSSLFTTCICCTTSVIN